MKLPQSWTTVTLLSKILAIILFVSLPFIGFCFGFKYHQSISVVESCPLPEIVQKPTVNEVSPTQKPQLDDRSCITGEIANFVNENFFEGKTFMNMSMSGEWGTLSKDYRLPINWGLDWGGPDDDRPNSGIGGWWIEKSGNELKIMLNRTTISDGTYTDFKYFEYKGNIFAIPREYMGLIFGPSTKTIEDFYKNAVKQCW